jgi:hypothetical protein
MVLLDKLPQWYALVVPGRQEEFGEEGRATRPSFALKVIYTVFIFSVLCQRSGSEQSLPTQPSHEDVSFCHLAQDWRKYDHKVIRTRAIYNTGRETRELYDIGCPLRETTSWVEFSPDIEKTTSKEVREKLSRLLRASGRARVTVIGEFHGPKKVTIPPNTPPKVAEMMRAVDSRYGHLNHWNFKFVFSKIEQVESVPASDPWTHWAGEKKR